MGFATEKSWSLYDLQLSKLGSISKLSPLANKRSVQKLSWIVLIPTITTKPSLYYLVNIQKAVSTSLLTATAAIGLIAVAIPALIASLG